MSDTSIEWTDKTWNPVTGCSKVSQGCKNCYAERIFQRPYPGRDFTDVRTHEDRLDAPLHWRKPARVFVNSMSDLFHEKVPATFIHAVFAAMAQAPRHTFQILTKRPERMLDVLSEFKNSGLTLREGCGAVLPNVWLGVSVEDQKTADERIPLLLQTPAAVRWVSYEPALGPVSFRWAKWDDWSPNERRKTQLPPVTRDGHTNAGCVTDIDGLRMLDWIVCGGESGPNARPMHPDWARSARDQCVAAGVPFFFKQWGEYADLTSEVDGSEMHKRSRDDLIFTAAHEVLGVGVRNVGGSVESDWRGRGGAWMGRVGKHAAGRLLDGREWNEYPVHHEALSAHN